ncbi:MAG: PDZ domain-containing protein [Phycisphaerales bacterium]
MTLFPKRTKNLLIASLIGATGIPASLAMAQFHVEYSSKAESKHVEQPSAPDAPEVQETRVIVCSSVDDEHDYIVRLVDGEVDEATIDGRVVDDDEIRVDGHTIVFISKDGEALHEIELPDIDPESPMFKTKVWSSAGGKDFDFDSDDNTFFAKLVGGEDGQDGQWIGKGQFSQPKVMLGINLGEPSEVLSKQLQLKGDAILVEDVIDGLPAKLSGMEQYDVIVSIDGSDEANGKILSKVLGEKDPGEIMKLVVLRGGEKVKVKVKLAAYDAEALGVQGRIQYDDQDMQFPGPDGKVQIKIMDELEDLDLGDLDGVDAGKIKAMIHRQLAKSDADQERVIELELKARDAMQQARRQMIEMRNGKLFVHSMDDLDDQLDMLKGELHGRMMAFDPDELEGRLEEISDRLDDMSDRLEDLAEMFEDLMESFDEDDD